MDKLEFYKAVTSYKASMKQAKTMLERGLISADDYAKIDTKLAQKYNLSLCSIYVHNDLLSTKHDGNIPYKEVRTINENNKNQCDTKP